MDVSAVLRQLTAGQSLDRPTARTFFEAVMQGVIEPAALGGVLAALATKGETRDEIVGAAEALRANVTPVALPSGVAAIDTCGTGGDGLPTFNISSAVAIVCAAAGATVAKHGNRSNARPSGSAEGLAALGINVEADVATLERCLAECRVAFLYAIKLHPAMKHAGPVRQALGIRTIFNLVGPITNPAGVRRQLLGVNRPELADLMLDVLIELGAERAVVVTGDRGACDLTLSGSSTLLHWDGAAKTRQTITATDLGLAAAPLEAIFVDSPAASAATIERLLAGDPGPARDTVALNAGAALWTAGLARDLPDGLHRAEAVLASGAARDTLAAWRRASRAAS
jgi:anthranilate phosphoribosyltransferase